MSGGERRPEDEYRRLRGRRGRAALLEGAREGLSSTDLSTVRETCLGTSLESAFQAEGTAQAQTPRGERACHAGRGRGESGDELGREGAARRPWGLGDRQKDGVLLQRLGAAGRLHARVNERARWWHWPVSGLRGREQGAGTRDRSFMPCPPAEPPQVELQAREGSGCPGWALALPGLGAAGPEATSASLPFHSPSVAPTFGFGKQGTCPLSCTGAGQASLRASAALLTWWVGGWRGQNDSRTSASESQRDHLLPCSSIPFSASLLTHLKGQGAHHLTGQCVTWMAFCLLESFPQGIKFCPPLAHTELTKPSRAQRCKVLSPGLLS